jgi:hypothetical protein
LAQAAEVEPEGNNPFGEFLAARGELQGPNDVILNVRTIWIRLAETHEVRFVTLFLTRNDRNMTVELFSEIALACDLPEEGLRRGDIATVIEKLPATQASGGEEGLILEVFNAIGETIALVTVPVSAVEPLRASEVLSVRPFRKKG